MLPVGKNLGKPKRRIQAIGLRKPAQSDAVQLSILIKFGLLLRR